MFWMIGERNRNTTIIDADEINLIAAMDRMAFFKDDTEITFTNKMIGNGVDTVSGTHVLTVRLDEKAMPNMKRLF